MPPVQNKSVKYILVADQLSSSYLDNHIFSVPKEMRVILQERENKLYMTSAYCLSKTISEIPLTILQPCVYMSVIYWVANLNNISAFFASLGILVVDVVTAQVY